MPWVAVVITIITLMSLNNNNNYLSFSSEEGPGAQLTAVAIDKDKHSPYAVRWAVDHLLLPPNSKLVLIHVRNPNFLQYRRYPFSILRITFFFFFFLLGISSNMWWVWGISLIKHFECWILNICFEKSTYFAYVCFNDKMLFFGISLDQCM